MFLLLTGDTLGNGVAEVFGYDANRLQLTSQSAAIPGYAPLMSLAYSYQAQAGQMGAGTTAGNAGQLMGITCCSSIGGVAELASYTYDNLGRLVTSNQTSNGTSAQRRFAYDRWGNRTGVWDATSGGTLIQNVALVQSGGGAPTNQIAALSTPGWYGSYTYDAAGNVTNDGVHTYQYDAEDRLVNVDGGATAQYAYDQNNRRYKKTVGSAVTQYVWEGSQIVSEHDGNGVILAEYIYAGNRVLAKISGNSTQYLLSDRLSERLSVDSGGNVVGRQSHLPFGEDFAQSGSQEKHHFTSYERDTETADDYALNRVYSQRTGTFNRPDPYAGSCDYGNPQSLNRNAYAANDPVNAMDPLGLCDGGQVWWNPPGGGIAVCMCTEGNCQWDFRLRPISENEPKYLPSPSRNRPVHKHYKRKFNCNKKAQDVLSEIEKDFSKFVNASLSFGPGDALLATVTFGSAPVETGTVIPISQTTSFPPVIIPPGSPGAGVYNPPPITINTSVTVYNRLTNSFSFVTNPGHPLYPGQITFSAIDAGDGKIRFAINVDAETNGGLNDFAFGHGGSELEDKIWNNLIDNVEKFCKQ